MGARLGADLSRRVANVVITNVPGRSSRCTWQARSCWPPTRSCPGEVHGGEHRIDVLQRRRLLGLNADRDAMDDIDVLTACISEAIDELLDTTRKSRTRAKRARKD